MSTSEQTPPPVGEEIHLPGPTLLPLLCAVGITLAVVGTTVGWVLTVAGLVLFVVTVARWVGETRRDVSQLPPGE